jgi:hypothetical protein
VNTSVSAHLVGRSAKALAVVLQAWQPLLLIVEATFQHLPASDDAALDLIHPDPSAVLREGFFAILSRFAGFVPANDDVIQLEQADDLLAGRHFFALKHASHGLRLGLLGSREKGYQDGVPSAIFLVCHCLQGRKNLLSLLNCLLGSLDQLAIGQQALLSSVLSTFAHDFPNLAGQTTHTAHSISEDLLFDLVHHLDDYVEIEMGVYFFPNTGHKMAQHAKQAAFFKDAFLRGIND